VTLPVVWLPEADAELKEALARYESIRPELAQRFAGAVSDTIEKVAAAPLHYAVVEKGRRRAGVRLPRAAQSKTLAVALNCKRKQFNAPELLVERYAFASACAGRASTPGGAGTAESEVG
jgi:hypothetical protein